MITFAVWQLVMVVGFVAIGYGAYKVYKRFDDRVEKRRTAAFDVATMLSTRGLKRLPRMLRCYAVGDYDGLGREIRKFVDAIEDGVPVIENEFDKVFDSILTASLKTETGMALVKAKIAEMEASSTPAVVL